ncbi:MAG TPA: hypothetical protein VMU69_02205 [Bradyrhizobium sp.]|nr:hypothetical protein [Bradyrhizobium sp.]
MSLKRLAIIGAVAVALAVGASAYAIYVYDPCETVVHRSIPSPDGSKMIVVFEAQCGATVGFNTQASLASASSAFSRRKNPSFFSMNGRHDLVVEWKDDKTVIMSVPPGDKIYRKDARADDVSVDYRE